MSLDGKILAAARNRLAANKRLAEEEKKRITERVYRVLPRVQEIDRQLALSVIEAAAAALDGGADPEKAVRSISLKNLSLQAERAELMVQAGYAPELLDYKPLCTRCGDTGFVNAKPCSCLLELYSQEQKKELSALLRLGKESFDSFSLDWYGEPGDPAREHMEIVYEICLEYARKFGDKSDNLFLNGGPGLGKTFLSACIAREVSQKGFSVVYDTAVNIFSLFEAYKFSREPGESVQSSMERYMLCDLLILDDLGTEMTTTFTQSALYDLINTRLCRGNKTIISSNLSAAELTKRYLPQTVSRILGEYENLRKIGKDIRLLKRDNN